MYGDLLVGGLIVLLLALAVATIVRDRRNGGGCCGCSGCNACKSCGDSGDDRNGCPKSSIPGNCENCGRCKKGE